MRCKGDSTKVRNLQDELADRHPSKLVKSTLRVKKLHAGPDAKYGRLVISVSKDAKGDLSGRATFIVYDFQRCPVQKALPHFIQCTKCALFNHLKKDCPEAIERCIRCGGGHFDRNCAEPMRCRLCMTYRPGAPAGHLAIGPACPICAAVQAGRIAPGNLTIPGQLADQHSV